MLSASSLPSSAANNPAHVAHYVGGWRLRVCGQVVRGSSRVKEDGHEGSVSRGRGEVQVSLKHPQPIAPLPALTAAEGEW